MAWAVEAIGGDKMCLGFGISGGVTLGNGERTCHWCWCQHVGRWGCPELIAAGDEGRRECTLLWGYLYLQTSTNQPPRPPRKSSLKTATGQRHGPQVNSSTRGLSPAMLLMPSPSLAPDRPRDLLC